MNTFISMLYFYQYSKIGSAVYDIDWYNLPGKKAFSLVLIIAMSHYPLKLTAGKMFDLSIYTFGFVSFSHKILIITQVIAEIDH